MNNMFAHKKIGEGITRIEGLGKVGMYLIEGTRKAMLIDAGVGIGDVRAYTESLTTLPVELYLTHGHTDHCGGAYLFDKVFVNKRDWEIFESAKTSFRFEYASMVAKAYGEPPIKEEWMVQKAPVICESIEPGTVIDLGGRKITAIDFYGHTGGSIVYYDDLTRSVFLGDACNNSTFLFLNESTDLKTYLQSLKKFKEEWMDRVEHLIISHDYDYVPMELVDNLIDCCEKVLSGTDDGEKFDHPMEEFAKMPIRWAYKGGPNREDGRFGNLAYNYTRI